MSDARFDFPPVQSNEFPPVLDVSPQSFKVDVVLHQDVFLDLVLHNITNQLVTFKVKTTARDRYLLKPTQDYIAPHQSKTCKIVMSALSTLPAGIDLTSSNTEQRVIRDKFLVQSVAVGEEVRDLSRYWKEREQKHNVKENRFAYHEQRIKCKLSFQTDREREENNSISTTASLGNSGSIQREVSSGLSAPSSSYQQMHRSMSDSQQAQATTTTTTAPTSNITSITVTTPQHSTSVKAEGAISSGSTPATSNATNISSTITTSLPTQQHQQQRGTTGTSSIIKQTPGEGEGDGRRRKVNAELEGEYEEKKKKEYNELMDFVVKLTAQMEREKQDTAIIVDKYQKALATIATLQKKYTILVQQQQNSMQSQTQQSINNNNTAAATPSSSSSSPSSAGATPSSLQAAGKEEVKGGATSAGSAASLAAAGGDVGASTGANPTGNASGSVRTRLMSGDGVRNNSGGLSWQIYQTILIAIIAFVLGRILSSK